MWDLDNYTERMFFEDGLTILIRSAFYVDNMQDEFYNYLLKHNRSIEENKVLLVEDFILSKHKEIEKKHKNSARHIIRYVCNVYADDVSTFINKVFSRFNNQSQLRKR